MPCATPGVASACGERDATCVVSTPSGGVSVGVTYQRAGQLHVCEAEQPGQLSSGGADFFCAQSVSCALSSDSQPHGETALAY